MDNTDEKFENGNSKEGFDEYILDSFRYIEGRRFHNVLDAKYFFPNDTGESDRLQEEHYLFQHVWKGNFSSPVQSTLNQPGATVLDVGCGPGTWVIDMASTFSSAIFIGLDISPMFPSDQKKPHNASFLQSNLLDGLPFPDNIFDFTHQSLIATALEESQWKDEAILELIRVTKPGGWIEFMEIESCKSDEIQSPNYYKIMNSFINFFVEQNINLKICPVIESVLKNNKQIKNVKHEMCAIPLGQWGGRLGEMAAGNFMSIYLTFKPSLSQFMGITHEEFDKMLRLSRLEMDSNKYFWNISRIYAQKK
ncbi:hypothetical protein Glove_166g23 [Diversispora epigaea]|uniref:Methyltransferase domain-containing protein n=1 Tax=Diversispora epigaea TaxID=1348612 RepID=A0A397IQW6_9GLOM|nr:hypothetical protein Glove_166g23 [Diversispora epigaea]